MLQLPNQAKQLQKKIFNDYALKLGGRVKSSLLQPGDRVLISNMTPRGGPGKLRNHWEDVVHTVVRQVNQYIPVYELRPEKGKGRSKTLHIIFSYHVTICHLKHRCGHKRGKELLKLLKNWSSLRMRTTTRNIIQCQLSSNFSPVNLNHRTL